MSKPQPRAAAPALMRQSPTVVSPRRLFQENLQDLHTCRSLAKVKQLHAQILKHDLHRDPLVTSKLVAALSSCRHLDLAVRVFNQVEEPDTRLYNTLIRAYGSNSQPWLAFAAFCDMQKDGVLADNYTYPFLLKGFSGEGGLGLVELVHAHVEKCGLLGDIFVPNSLIDSYCKCGAGGMGRARRLFESMGERDVVSWNSMVAGLVRAGCLEEAREMFDEMPVKDAVSWNTLLDGYAKAGKMDVAYVLFERMPERNVVSWSTMIWGFRISGDMEMARMLFDKMPVRNLVPWTIIVSGYAEMGQVKEAVKLFDQMEAAGMRADDGSVLGILAACAESGMLQLGKRVHNSIRRTRFKCSVNVFNALVDMYMKCGDLDEAWNVFSGMQRDVFSWNCMLQGLAINGHGERVFSFFSRMKRDGFQPDKVTLLAVLCGCTHSGLVDEGIQFFNNMKQDYGIAPEVEHYGCVVDLLGRAGRLKEAFRLVQSMPMEPNAIVWGTLLGACRTHGAHNLAEYIVRVVDKRKLEGPGNYTTLSNIFAAGGDWSSAANMRMQMRNTGIQKPLGASFIEVDNEVHEFTVFDESHPQSDNIYQMIHRLGKNMKKLDHVVNV